MRATVSGFGPLLLSKVLGLNATQESSLGLVFHYADAHGLALVDLSDLRSVLKLVFFFDEAHLLFRDASKDFIAAIVQTVRLIRSKGVGVFFVTQTPKDVPSEVLGQLGSRVQHALRAFTPDDAKALRATVGTYPKSGYDLERVMQELGTGEAIVTVMSEKGAPTPVAWTRLRAPQGLMSPTPDAAIDAAVAASALLPKYGTAIDRESAREVLAAKMNAAEAAQAAESAAVEKAKADAALAKQQMAAEKEHVAAEKKAQLEYERLLKKTSGQTRTSRASQKSAVEQVLGSKTTQTILNGVIRGIFGTGRR